MIFYIFKKYFYPHQNPIKLKLILRNLYIQGAIRLKTLPFFSQNLQQIRLEFYVLLSLLHLLPLWLASFNLVDYMNVAGKYVT